ncbi:uncharacterized protein LOC131149179 isoform X2 [Malania oleifera]|uniref:uncharacterized protein LOC131149179 isoform X2 n=1 Tax=Malania oleifera TaxID=397392 RepID=UPI0025AE849C|nr:uncharacterized protein LOC131149179 isoform X2 [Malania oleifera]
MESQSVFHAPMGDEEQGSRGYKLVPWLNWDEWNFVRKSLFSSSQDAIASALRRISTWRSRGCLPDVIEITSSFIEIQQKDPFFRADLIGDATHSEEMLAMLYCMAIVRLVNCVIEKTRKKSEVSIAEAADRICIPRMLIDIRHEGSHRDLPSLQLVRVGSIQALDWLKSNYWEAQRKSILFQSKGTSNIRKKVNCRLHELALCLKFRKSIQLPSSLVKGKRPRRSELFYGSNKFFSLVSGKLKHSKCGGSKKQISRIVKNLVGLYSSSSSEVVSLLLEFLIKSMNSSDSVDLPNNSQIGENTEFLQTSFDDWKLVITKLSSKEPKLLLSLISAVLDLAAKTCGVVKNEIWGRYLTSPEKRADTSPEKIADMCQVENLSSLFAWLIKYLWAFDSKSAAAESEGFAAGVRLPKETLREFLRKCLMLLAPGNDQLMGSVLLLARMIGSNSLVEKLSKLSVLGLFTPDFSEENHLFSSHDKFISQQEDSLCQAAEKLEFVKRHVKVGTVKTNNADVGEKKIWAVAKSWNPCPIGMLPSPVSSSGCDPVLDCDHKAVLDPSERKVQAESIHCTGKREASRENELVDNKRVKKMRETIGGCESDSEDVIPLEAVNSRLMIDGFWKQVGKEELSAIESAVRILV